MSAMRILTVLLVGALTMTWAGAAKAVPDAVPYIGYLTDDQGPYDSSGTPLEISVTVYDQEAGGQLVWGPCNFSQPVENGVFVVVLDAIACPGMNDTPLPTTGAWLEFTVATTPLQGRQELLSVPYALWADSTQTCEEASSLTQEGDGSVTAADLAAKDHNHDALYVNEGQAGSVTAGMLGPDAVTGPAIASGSIALADLGDWGCQDGQVVKWVDGSSLWACANDLGGGGAQYTAGTGLSLQGTEFSVIQAVVEGWAQGVCYDTPAELAAALSGWDQNASNDLTTSTTFGGDVQGTYGSLQLGAGVVAFADIGPNGCQAGDAMVRGGSAWGCTPVFSQGQATANFDPAGSAAAVADDLGENYYTSADLDGGQLDTRYYTEQECLNLFAPKGTTYSKTEVDQAIAAAIAALDDCPAGYSKVVDANILATGFYCRKAVGGGKYDEIAKVGDFWIDRYEVSIWQNSDCTGTQYGGSSDNWASSGATGTNADNGFFPRNGNATTTRLYGCSIPGVTPSRWMTWFQAQQVCAAQGKHLCTNGEWQMAAGGSPDPGAYPDTNDTDGCTAAPITGKCNTCSTGPRATGDAWYLNFANSCMSAYGAFDMVGNLWEWADLWGQAGRDMGITQGASATPWPTGYREDATWNINGEAHDGAAWKTGLPASAFRGGSWDNGTRAGVFALHLDGGPSHWNSNDGARCCRRK